MDLIEKIVGIVQKQDIWQLFQDNWVIILVVLGIWGYSLIFGNRCPKCKKAHAMKRTGNKMASRRFIFGGTNYEKKCKYCGYCVWEDVPNVSGGDGGGP